MTALHEDFQEWKPVCCGLRPLGHLPFLGPSWVVKDGVGGGRAFQWKEPLWRKTHQEWMRVKWAVGGNEVRLWELLGVGPEGGPGWRAGLKWGALHHCNIPGGRAQDPRMNPELLLLTCFKLESPKDYWLRVGQTINYDQTYQFLCASNRIEERALLG